MLIGRLTKDPELSYSPKGTPIAALSLACNRTWKDESGNKQEEVTFIDISVWSRLAEVVEQYTRKGSPIFIEGRLQLNTWETGGVKHSKLRVIGENLQLLGGRREGSEATPSAAFPPRPAAERSQTAPASKAPFHEPELDDIPY